MSLKAEIHVRLGPGGIEAQNLLGSDPVMVRLGPRIQLFRFGFVDPWLKLKVDGPTKIPVELESSVYPGVNLMSQRRCHVVTNDVT